MLERVVNLERTVKALELENNALKLRLNLVLPSIKSRRTKLSLVNKSNMCVEIVLKSKEFRLAVTKIQMRS